MTSDTLMPTHAEVVGRSQTEDWGLKLAVKSSAHRPRHLGGTLACACACRPANPGTPPRGRRNCGADDARDLERLGLNRTRRDRLDGWARRGCSRQGDVCGLDYPTWRDAVADLLPVATPVHRPRKFKFALRQAWSRGV